MFAIKDAHHHVILLRSLNAFKAWALAMMNPCEAPEMLSPSTSGLDST